MNLEMFVASESNNRDDQINDMKAKIHRLETMMDSVFGAIGD